MNIDTINRVAFATNMAIRGNTSSGWRGMATVWRARLSRETRMALALAALSACDNDDAQGIIDGLAKGSGMPQAALLSEMDQAAHWASLATTDELDAYCLTAFRWLAPRRQAEFLAYVGKGVAA